MRAPALLLLLACAAWPPSATAPAAAQEVPVDLELILAVDTSQSINAYEGRLQRQGYVLALSDPRVVQAIRGGAFGRIALTYLEWAGPGLWRKIADWRIVDSAETAHEFAGILAQVPIARGRGTSITGVVFHAIGMFEGNGVEGFRRVIDVSGDGPNSSGGIVTYARAAAIAAGVTVNGLAINNDDGSRYTLPDLDLYYRECVIGGPGAFVIAAEGFESFADAILRKLILEIAGIGAPGPYRFAASGIRRARADGPTPAQALKVQKYAPACDIGERMRLLDNPGLVPPSRRLPANPVR